MSDAAERPLAPEETERRVKDTFPIAVSPEEFAARDGYGWLDFPFGRYRYRDPQLDEWIQVVREILQTPSRLRACQAKYLTPEEMRLIAKYLQDDDNESLDD
jgi:hypothetical protein